MTMLACDPGTQETEAKGQLVLYSELQANLCCKVSHLKTETKPSKYDDSSNQSC